MARHVLDHHDGVIHQNADREDQSEQRDPVQRVTIEVEDRERERERHGNGGGDNACFPQTEDDPDQQRDREDGNHHVEQKFIRLLTRRLAVIARNYDIDIAWNQRALQQLDLLNHLISYRDSISAFAFSDGDRDCRQHILLCCSGGRCIPLLCRSGSVKNIIGRLFRTVFNSRHIAQVHGAAVGNTDNHIAYFFGGLQEASGLDEKLAVAR